MTIDKIVFGGSFLVNLLVASQVLIGQQMELARASNQQKDSIPTVSVCELTTRPELYENKVVRVDAIYFALHTASLYDKECQGIGKAIYFELDCKSQASCKKMNAAIGKGLSYKSHWARARIVVIGRFKGPPKSGATYGALIGPQSGFKYKIEVRKIEASSRIPIDEPLE